MVDKFGNHNTDLRVSPALNYFAVNLRKKLLKTEKHYLYLQKVDWGRIKNKTSIKR